jgi:hypothetical protein
MAIALHCTSLHCTALHCTALHCTALRMAARGTVLELRQTGQGFTAARLPTLHCTALHCTALHCTALHCTALHCTALQCIALHCTALHCTALHCTALHCTEARLPLECIRTKIMIMAVCWLSRVWSSLPTPNSGPTRQGHRGCWTHRTSCCLVGLG